LVFVALSLGACSTVDFDAPKAATYADIDTRDTTFARRLVELREKNHPDSGFFPLSTGVDALAGRLLLVERAERTLDIQYYLWGDDPIGDLFFDRVFAAADRGVRVRLLIDDIGTRNIEEVLPILDAHPNIQLRLFNPFASRGVRLFDAWDGRRLNRRMHNKSLTADNEVTIMGGRNIAAEYFSANPKYNFGDLDVVGIGTVVRDTSKMFDRYWNDRYSVPYSQLNPEVPSDAEQASMRDALRASFAVLTDSPYAEVVSTTYKDFEFTLEEGYFWAPYKLVYDEPDKALAKETQDEDRIITSLARVVESAQKEVLVISPYFVPRKRGVDWLSGIADRGVQIDVLTNGLAANDHLLVYGGYAPVRKPLLRQGVRFYELRGDMVIDGTKESGSEDADSKLHGKAFIVDRRYVFIGSFNWDPRSANLNTEMGVVIAHPELAGMMAEGVYDAVRENAYTVTLEDDGGLKWTTSNDGVSVSFDREPESTWWKRFTANMSRILPIRGQL
jgi:putative cardiolipin synthase